MVIYYSHSLDDHPAFVLCIQDLHLYWKLKLFSFGTITNLSESLPIWTADSCNLLGLLSYSSGGWRNFFPFVPVSLQISKSRSAKQAGIHTAEDDILVSKKWAKILIPAGRRFLAENVLFLQSHLIIAFKLMSLSCEQIQSAVYQREIRSQQEDEVD